MTEHKYLPADIFPDGVHIRLRETLWVPFRGGGGFHVPAGFISDGYSVPWLFRRTFPRFGRGVEAAVAHDYLYATQSLCTKKEADKVLLDRMEDLGVMGWKKRLIYRAVMFFGSKAWRDNKKKLAANRAAKGTK